MHFFLCGILCDTDICGETRSLRLLSCTNGTEGNNGWPCAPVAGCFVDAGQRVIKFAFRFIAIWPAVP